MRSRRLLRAMGGTVLAGGTLGIGAAGAQTVSLPNPTNTTVTNNAAVPAAGNPLFTNPDGNTLNVALNAAGTVITWNGGFNVPTGKTVNFSNGLSAVAGTQVAVLNRDVTGNASQLLGNLTSANNISVWVYNPTGIMVGSGARINTGSLVLSTLNVDQTQFLNTANAGATASFHLTNAGGAGGINVQAGANITVTGGNRGLVMVAPQIQTAGVFDATGSGGGVAQDVAFVVASDVTVSYASGSPLSVTLAKGTAVGGAQVIAGSVSGRDALFALASQGTVTDALLKVDATVTAAGATERGIVLSAGAPVSGVTVNGAPADVGGVAGVTATGPIASLRDVVIGSNGIATVTGPLLAAGNYAAMGSGVVLGGAGAVTQGAEGAVSITASGGSITGVSGLTLQSNSRGTGTGDVSLTTAGATGGDISFAPGTALVGGTNRQSAVRIAVRSASNNVTLDTVSAASLVGGVGQAGSTGALSIGGALSVGAVDTQAALSLSAGSLSAGTLRSETDGIALAASGAITAASINASSGGALLNAGGAITVAGPLAVRDAVSLSTPGAVSLGDVSATAVQFGSGANPLGSLTVGALTAGDIGVVTNGDQSYAGAITASGALTAVAGGAVRLTAATAGGNLVLQGTGVTATGALLSGGALSLRALRDGVDARGGLQAANALSIMADAGPVLVGTATSSAGPVFLTATTGDVGAAALRAAGDISISAGGRASVTGAVAAGGAYRVVGTGVTLGTAGARTDQSAGGDVAIIAGAGGIAGLSGLTLTADSLGAGGKSLLLSVSDPAGGIAFDPASALRGGPAGQSLVAIRSGSAATRLSLGAVSASSLLGASGSDPFAAGLVRSAALTVGDISVTGPLTLSAPGLTTGALVSGSAVTLGGAGPITAALIASAGPVLLTGAGDLSIGGGVRTTNGGSLAVDRSGAVTLGGLQVAGNATIGGSVQPTALTVTGSAAIGGALVSNVAGVQNWGAVSAGDTKLGGAGAITLASLASGGTVRVSGTGDLTVAGTLAAAGNAVIDRDGAVSLGGLQVNNNAVIGGTTAPASLSIGGVSVVGGALVANSVGAQRWAGTLTAGSATLTARTLTLGDLSSRGDVGLMATGGDLTAGAVTAGLGLTMRASGAVSAGALSGAAVVLDAATTLGTGTVSATAGDVIAFGGTMTLAGVNAAGRAAVIARSGALTVSGAASAGGSFDAEGPGDVLLAGGGGSGGLFSITAGGLASLGGTVNAAALRITGTSVALGAGARITSAGSVDLNATTGGVTGGAGLLLASTASDSAQFVRIQAAGAAGIAFAPDSRIDAGGTTVALRAVDAAATLRLGAVNARALVGLTAVDGDPATQATAITAAAPVFGALTLVNSFAARATTGDLTIGALTVSGAGQGISLAADAGALNAPTSLAADGDIALSARAPLALGSITSTGGRVSLSSGGGITASLLSGAGGVTATGTTLSIGGIAGGAAMLSATAGALGLGGGNAAAATLTATGDVTVGGALTLAQGLNLTAGGTATLAGTTRAGGAASITAQAVSVPDLGAGGALAITARSGSVGGASGGGAVLSAGGDLSVTAAGNATLAGASAGGRLTVGVATLSAGPLSAGGDLRLAATGDAAVSGPVSAGGAYAVSGRSVTLNGVERAGGAVMVIGGAGGVAGLGQLVLTSDTGGAGGALSITTTGGAINLAAGSTLNGGAARQADVLVDAGGGAVALGTVNARSLLVNSGVRRDAAITTGDLSLTNTLTLLGGAGGVRTGAVSVSAGDLTLDAGTGALSTGALNASGLATLAGARVDEVSLSAGAVRVTAGALGLGSGTIGATGPVAIASGGAATLGDLTTTGAGGDVSVTAGGALLLGAVQSSGAARLATTGARADLVATGGVTATGAVSVASTGDIRTPFLLSRTGTLTVSAPNGSAGGLNAGDLLSLTAGAGQSYSLTVGGDLRLGALVGGPVSLFARSISALSIDAGTGLVNLNAGGGDLTVGGGVKGGDVTLTAAGATSIGGAIAATGAVRLAGTRLLTFGDVSGGSVLASSGGAITGGAITAGGSVGVTGGSVSLATVAAGSAVTLGATAGDLTLGGATAGGDLSASATGTVAIPGAVTAGGSYLVRGATVSLGAAGVTQAAGGRVDLTSTAGDLNAASGLTLTAGPTGSLVLDSAGAIGFAGVQLQAGGALGLRAGDGRTVTLGGVQAASLGGVDAAHGDFSAAFAHAGNVTTGDLTVGRAAITLTAGDLVTGKVTSGGAVALAAAGALSTGAVSAATLDLSASNALTGGDFLATGAARVAGNDVTLASVTAGGDLGLTARGVLGVGTVAARGAATLTGATVRVDSATGASLAVTSAGDLTGRNGARAALTSTAGDLSASAGGQASLATLSSGGAATVTAGSVDISGKLGAARALLVKARQALTVAGATSAGGDATLTAGGAAMLGSVGAGGALSVSGGTVSAGAANAGGALSVTSAGDLSLTSGQAGTDAMLTAGGAATLGQLGANGALTVKANSVSASAASAGGTLSVASTGALSLAAAQAGGDATLTAGGAATLGQLRAGGALIVKGGTVSVAAANAGGVLAVTSLGNLSLTQAQAGGAATITAGGLATLGQLVAGPSITLTAADAELTGTVRAPTVTINNAATTGTLRLGDGTGADGFRLSAAELAQISTDTLTLNGGAGAVELGTVALAPTAGTQAVRVFSTGRITVDGAVSGAGAGRSIVIGGAADSVDAKASAIRIAATSDAGGRLLFPDANLDLRGLSIAAGLTPGFLTPLDGGDAAGASAMVNNPASALYNANLGGGFYAAGAGTLIAAHSLTVRYTDYALFQNTALPGSDAGVALGSDANPAKPALVLIPGNSGGHDSFALFGTINGIGQTAAALLGPDSVSVTGANLAATRINGCLVGSGAGCLASITIQPTLQVFRQTHSDVFGAAEDLTVPFDPVIGGANEALLTGLELAGSVAPDTPGFPAPAPLTGSATPAPPQGTHP